MPHVQEDMWNARSIIRLIGIILGVAFLTIVFFAFVTGFFGAATLAKRSLWVP